MFHSITSFFHKVVIAITIGIASFHSASVPPQPIVIPQAQIQGVATSTPKIESPTTPSATQVSAVKNIPPAPTPKVSVPVPVVVTSPVPVVTTNICNGVTYAACPSDMDFTCRVNSTGYCAVRKDAAYYAEQEAITASQAQQQTVIQQEADQAKQAKLNAINLQIANLNAKYALDIKNAEACGGACSIESVQASKSYITTHYQEDYNTLVAQFQQIQYSN